MFNLPDLNVTGFESKAYIRYYLGRLVFSPFAADAGGEYFELFPLPAIISSHFFTPSLI